MLPSKKGLGICVASWLPEVEGDSCARSNGWRFVADRGVTVVRRGGDALAVEGETLASRLKLSV